MVEGGGGQAWRRKARTIVAMKARRRLISSLSRVCVGLWVEFGLGRNRVSLYGEIL